MSMSSGEALGDVDTKVLEVVHPLHRGPVEFKGGVDPSLLLTKVHYQLLPGVGCCPDTSGSGPLLPTGRPFHCYL